MIFHHFTSEFHLGLITAAGLINATESNIGSGRRDWRPFGEHVGPDVVWLTDDPDPDEDQSFRGSLLNKTAVRLDVDVDAIKWTTWGPAKRMHRDWRRALVLAAGGRHVTDHWWVHPGPISTTRVTAIHHTIGADR